MTIFKGSQRRNRIERAARFLFGAAGAVAFVMATLPQPPPMPGQPPDKLLHVLVFATLGMLAAVGFRQQSVLRLLLGLSIFGAVIELVQAIPMLNRHSELADLLADMVGALGALTVTRWLLKRRPDQGAN